MAKIYNADLIGKKQSVVDEILLLNAQVGSQPCRSVSQGVDTRLCLPKTAWPPTYQDDR